MSCSPVSLVEHEEHVLAVLAPVAGLLPQRLVVEQRRLDLLEVVALPARARTPRACCRASCRAASRTPRRATTGWNWNRSSSRAELAVIALLRFLDPVEVRVQLVLLEEGRAVDALQHLPLLVAAPVRAGAVQQLEVLEPPGVGHVRAAAQVDERTVRVRRDDLGGVGEVVEPLELERVVDEALARLRHADLLAHERILLRHHLAHLGLELLEVLGREGRRDLEVVVEAVVDGRAEADLRVGAQPSHRRGEDVRGRVAQHRERVGIALGEDAERAAAPQRRHEILDLAVHRDGDRGHEQPLADRAHDVGRERAGRHHARGPVGEDEGELGSGDGGGGVGSVDHASVERLGVRRRVAGAAGRRGSTAPVRRRWQRRSGPT